jgi:hypothetical protein
MLSRDTAKRKFQIKCVLWFTLYIFIFVILYVELPKKGQKSQKQELEAGTSFLVGSWFLP